VLGAVLGVTGFAFASVSGLVAAGVAADSHIPAGKIWVTKDGSDKGPAQGDAVRTFDCTNIDVQAFKLKESKGEFTLYFDDHNGDDKKITTGDWKFNKDKKDDQQVIASIDGKELISKLKSKGAEAQDNGFHMDLVFTDPEKTVEFIIENNCPEEHKGGESTPPTPVHQQQVPPPIVKGVTTAAPKPAAVVPQTGADAPFLTGMLLMSAGGAALAGSRRLRRRNAR
jgi:hypothetical protein